ncbi:hypothetical protein BS78_07G021400 [Paspalum vaginatum]|nr:hypothetical protein BS78_07G021400 [Paspalum vaginatum]
MQGGRGGRNGLFGFGDPFAGFGQPPSIMSSFFGGANPFDDPFFANPFGGMMQPGFGTPFGSMMQPSLPSPFSSMMQPGLLAPSLFGPHANLNGGVFRPQTDLNQGMRNASGFSQQAPEPSRHKGGPIIKELSSDDEDDADDNREDEKKKGNSKKHTRASKEPYVEHPDEEAQDKKRPKQRHFGREFSRASTSHPQPQTFMFQSSTVSYGSYGGPSGACYTSSTTRRTGADGITLEESKEADTTTGKATHRISRGIGCKGHSLTRNLNSDGHVNTLQTLHNLNEDELAGFEESWQRNSGDNLPGWDPRMNTLGNGNVHPGFREANQMPALPAPNHGRTTNSSRNTQNGSSMGRARRA